MSASAPNDARDGAPPPPDTRRPAARSRRALGGPALLGAVVAAVYALSFAPMSDGMLLGNDVVPYARGLVVGAPDVLWNPHHLLQHPLAWLLYRGLVGLGLPADVATALQAQVLLSAAAGGMLAAWVASYTAHRVGGWAALGLAVSLAASAGQWLYGAVGETYLPATAALAWVLIRAIEDERSVSADLRLALGFLLALLLRQDSVLACAALVVLLPWRSSLRVIGLAGAGSLALYFAVWVLAVRGGQGHAEFAGWLRGLAETGLWGAAPDGERLALGAGVQQLAWHYGAQPVYGAAWAAAAWGATGLLLLGTWTAGRRADFRARVCLGLLLFVLVRFGFFAWWQPTNLEYHAGTWLPICLAAVPSAARWRPRNGMPLAAAPWLACALLLGASHAILLWLPYRGGQIHERTTEALDAVREADAEPGLVLALDVWSVYALQRADFNGPWADASEAAAGRAPGSAWIQRAEAVLSRGGRVALSRELLLMGRLGLGELPLKESFLDALVALGEIDTRSDETGRPYLLILAPRTAREAGK
jgi:hypothetical protein